MVVSYGDGFLGPRHPGIFAFEIPGPRGSPRGIPGDLRFGESRGISGKIHTSGNVFHFLYSHLHNNMIFYIYNFFMQQIYKHISSSVEASLPSSKSAFAKSFSWVIKSGMLSLTSPSSRKLKALKVRKLSRVAAVQASHASPFVISNLRHWVKKKKILAPSFQTIVQAFSKDCYSPDSPHDSLLFRKKTKNRCCYLHCSLAWKPSPNSKCYFDVNFHMLMLLNEVQVHLEYPLQNLIIEVDSLSVALTVLEF